MSITKMEIPPADIPPPEDGWTLSLFDNSAYRKPRKVGIKVTGTVWLDPADQGDLALLEQIEPGASVSWQIEGQVVGGGSRILQDAEGNIEGTQFIGSVNVGAVYAAG